MTRISVWLQNLCCQETRQDLQGEGVHGVEVGHTNRAHINEATTCQWFLLLGYVVTRPPTVFA